MIETLKDDQIATGMMHVLWAGAALDTLSDVLDLLDAMAVLRPGNGGCARCWRGGMCARVRGARR